MLRVLIADDQIPDENIPDSEVLTWAKTEYPGARKGFINAFAVMREAVKKLRDGYKVTVARRLDDALALIQSESFDVAIIDLGWAGDSNVPKGEERTAGWGLIDAIESEDAKHPERAPTAQIIYSSRFETHPDLGQEAAARGILPFYKPYGERHSLPLGDELETKVSPQERIRVACESLRGVVRFIEQLQSRSVERVLQLAAEGLARANQRERQWDRITLLMLTVGVFVVLAGVVASLFGSLPWGAVTAASGAVIALIPELMFGRLDVAYEEIDKARHELVAVLKGASG